MGEAPLVVIDPGHGGGPPIGGSTPNRAEGAGVLEKDLCLDIALRLRQMLEDWGTEVVLTRDADRNLSLADRARIARTNEAAAFVSVHFGTGRQQGALTAVHPSASAASRELASVLQAGLPRALSIEDQGVRALELDVLAPAWHHSDTAAVLVEPFVLDAMGAPELVAVESRGRIAGAIGNAVRRWIRRGWDRPLAPFPKPAVAPTRAILVGVDRYPFPLKYAVRDAEAMAQVAPTALGVSQSDVSTLVNPSVTQIHQACAGMPRDGLLFVYLAGRGCRTADGEPAFIAADGEVVTAGSLRRAVGPDPRLVIVADAGTTDSGEPGGRGDDRVVPSDPGRALWLGGCRPGEDTVEHTGVGHGVFTSALLDRMGPWRIDATGEGLAAVLRWPVQDIQRRLGVMTSFVPTCRPDVAGLPILSPQTAPPTRPLRGVRHWVPLVPQTSSMSCWAAAAAMLVGWRDTSVWHDRTLARRLPGKSDAFERGLRPDDIAGLAQKFGLEPLTPRVYGVQELADLLETHGPLWVGEADPDLHVVVVHGMHGDGTLDGTEVAISDPWPLGRGERYTVSFREFMSNFHAATTAVGPHVQLLHCGGRTLEEPP